MTHNHTKTEPISTGNKYVLVMHVQRILIDTTLTRKHWNTQMTLVKILITPQATDQIILSDVTEIH